MAYIISPPLAGVDVTAAASTTQAFALGTEVLMSDGSKWKYLSIPTSTTITQYAVYAIASLGNSRFTVAALTTTIAARGVAMAIAQQAVTSDANNVQYMWFLFSNPAADTTYKVRVAPSCAIDAKLASTANAGVLDDTTASSTIRIDGIALTDSQPAGSTGSRTFRTSNQGITWGGFTSI